MGREIHDRTHVVHSSIALLQERFRQLQRVKEMREERELLRILSEPSCSNKQYFINLTNPTVTNYEPGRFVFHSDVFFPQRSSPIAPQVSLSLRPALQSSAFEADDQYYCSSSDQTPLLMKLWPVDYISPSFKASSDKSLLDCDPYNECSDVDTSLHL